MTVPAMEPSTCGCEAPTVDPDAPYQWPVGSRHYCRHCSRSWRLVEEQWPEGVTVNGGTAQHVAWREVTA